VKQAELVSLMVGRGISARKRTSHAQHEIALKVENLCRGTAVQGANFELRKGEVLGIAGLVGSGRTELVRLIAGADKLTSGTIAIDGKPATFHSVREAISAGVALLPEDRKKEGIIPLRSVRANAALPNFRNFSKAGFVRHTQLREKTLDLSQRVNLRPLATERRISLFSGGNQQKAILVRWLMANSKVIIFDEPTRGIDVGAKEEIYQIIEALAAEGKGIIVVSSELPEVLRVSDRVLVMQAGRQAGLLSREDTSEENIMSLAFSKIEQGAA
jgi:ribose transport system ATP-binding protein